MPSKNKLSLWLLTGTATFSIFPAFALVIPCLFCSRPHISGYIHAQSGMEGHPPNIRYSLHLVNQLCPAQEAVHGRQKWCMALSFAIGTCASLNTSPAYYTPKTEYASIIFSVQVSLWLSFLDILKPHDVGSIGRLLLKCISYDSGNI